MQLLRYWKASNGHFELNFRRSAEYLEPAAEFNGDCNLVHQQKSLGLFTKNQDFDF